jgi:hypothetical protein
MVGSIDSAIKSGHGNAILYAGALGLLLSDIIPTPADAVYFRLQEKNKTKLEQGIITPRQYWTRDAFAYYGLNPLFWSLVLFAMVVTKGSVGDKAKVGLAIIGGGAVLGVLGKNIKEEEKKINKIK